MTRTQNPYLSLLSAALKLIEGYGKHYYRAYDDLLNKGGNPHEITAIIEQAHNKGSNNSQERYPARR